MLSRKETKSSCLAQWISWWICRVAWQHTYIPNPKKMQYQFCLPAESRMPCFISQTLHTHVCFKVLKTSIYVVQNFIANFRVFRMRRSTHHNYLSMKDIRRWVMTDLMKVFMALFSLYFKKVRWILMSNMLKPYEHAIVTKLANLCVYDDSFFFINQTFHQLNMWANNLIRRRSAGSF